MLAVTLVHFTCMLERWTGMLTEKIFMQLLVHHTDFHVDNVLFRGKAIPSQTSEGLIWHALYCLCIIGIA